MRYHWMCLTSLFLKLLTFCCINHLANIEGVKLGTLEGSKQYAFFSCGIIINVDIKTHGNAHIFLGPRPVLDEPMYDIIIGGWGNLESGIALYKNNVKMRVKTPRLLSNQTFKNFDIRIMYGQISVWHINRRMLYWKNSRPFYVKYIGVNTFKTTGQWKIKQIGNEVK